MNPLGIHLVLDAWECPPELLDDERRVRDTLVEAVEVGGATLIDLCTHKFSPQGVTATATLAESHISIHTWPEHGYFACDVFFCGAGDPYAAIEHVRERLDARTWKLVELKRGIEPRAQGARADGDAA